MSTFWKIMIGLMVTLPVGAYVAGNLAGAIADGPAPHSPIVIREARTTPLPGSLAASRRPHDSGPPRQQE